MFIAILISVSEYGRCERAREPAGGGVSAVARPLPPPHLCRHASLLPTPRPPRLQLHQLKLQVPLNHYKP